MAVHPTLRTFYLYNTVVRYCGTTMLLPLSAKVAKNLKVKKRKTLNEFYPTFFFLFCVSLSFFE